MSYTPRTSAPSSGDKRWTKIGYGGYNAQILGRPSAWSGSVLANCTGYVHGRWMELGGVTSEYDLSNGNANTYWGHADGYERGQEPRLGAVLCLGGGGYGHVAIVEEIFDNGDIMVSESNYGRAVFEYVRRYKSTGYKRSGGSVGGFQGFIYHPSISPPTPPAPPKYNLTVVNGRADLYVEEAGTVTNIYADQPKGGLVFYKWIASTTNGTIANPNIMNTTFTFGNGDNTITALYRKRDSLSLMYYISPISLRRRM